MRLSSLASRISQTTSTPTTIATTTLPPIGIHCEGYSPVELEIKKQKIDPHLPYHIVPDDESISPVLRAAILSHPCSLCNPRRSTTSVRIPGLAPFNPPLPPLSAAGRALSLFRLGAFIRCRLPLIQAATTTRGLDETVLAAHWQALILAFAAGDFSVVEPFVSPQALQALAHRRISVEGPALDGWALVSGRVSVQVLGAARMKVYNRHTASLLQSGVHMVTRIASRQRFRPDAPPRTSC